MRLAHHVFRTTIRPLGYTVQCDKSCWTRHILPEHIILSGHEEDVEKAVHDPDVITYDVTKRRRLCLYRYDVGISVPGRHLKVVVELRRFGNHAHVITAYTVDRLKTGEAVKWQRAPAPEAAPELAIEAAPEEPPHIERQEPI